MKQTTLLLYGSLTLGLVVTLFGTFEPIRESINDNLSVDWFGIGIKYEWTELDECLDNEKYFGIPCDMKNEATE